MYGYLEVSNIIYYIVCWYINVALVPSTPVFWTIVRVASSKYHVCAHCIRCILIKRAETGDLISEKRVGCLKKKSELALEPTAAFRIRDL